MGMDLNFWKYKEGAVHDDSKIYELACCDGELAEVLEPLPIDDILDKIASVFSDWASMDKKHFEKENRGAFEVFTTPQVVRFDCYGMEGEDMNSLMDILIGFGCPLYDPQIPTRFDSWTDR